MIVNVQKAVFAWLLLSAVAFAGVYDDVTWWMRGTYNGTSPDNPSIDAWHEIVHALELGNPSIDADAYSHVTPFGAGEDVLHVITDVACPYAGKTLKNRSVVRLAQTVKENGQDGSLVGRSSVLLMYMKGAAYGTTANTNRYTVLMRYKMEGKYSPTATETILVDYGWAYSQNSGFQLRLRGDDDNQYFYVYRGNTWAAELKATMDSPDTRLSCGKWVDVAIVSDYNNFYIYTCAEGGRLCVQHVDRQPNNSTVSRTDVNIGGHAFNSGSKTYSADFSAITSAMDQSFRGWIQQYAIWHRALTESEVKEAFMDGCGGDDLLRFGVANDSAYEFNGQGTETDADLATDWRGLPQALTAAAPTATIRFSAGVCSFGGRRFSIKTTSASETGCTLSATLNGKTLLDNAPAAPGATLVADVAMADLICGSNALVLTRTDGGNGRLEIDCLSIGDFVQDEYVYRGVPVRDDPYADAFGWWRHCVDVDGNSAFDPATEYPNALMAKSSLSGHARNVWTMSAPLSNYALESQDVAMPLGGRVLNGEKCLYFSDSMWNSGGNNRYFGGAVYQLAFVATNTAGYSLFGRFKVKAFPSSVVDGDNSKSTLSMLMGLASSWSDNTGIDVSLQNDRNDESNLSLLIHGGQSTMTLSDTQTGDARNRLGVGKWMDIALVVSNRTVRVYTAVEGGTGVVCLGPYGINGGTALAERSWFSVGGKDRYGTSGAWGVPEYLRGWVHSCAIWPRVLSDDDVRLAMGWPYPDLVRIGVADGTACEFADGAREAFTTQANGDFKDASPAAVSSAGAYTVNFDVPAEEVGRNQLFRLAALDGSDVTAGIQLSINGTVVTNYLENATPTSRFLPDENGVYEVGVLRDVFLVEGANTLTVRGAGGAQGSGFIGIDAISLGNCGRRVKVRTGRGLVITFQ